VNGWIENRLASLGDGPGFVEKSAWLAVASEWRLADFRSEDDLEIGAVATLAG